MLGRGLNLRADVGILSDGMKKLLLVVVGSLGLACAGSAAENPIQAAVKGDLVMSEGKKLKPYDDALLAPVKYYGIYYSASWCGPCRAFTPDLAFPGKKTKRKYPQFELIFVSSDRSEEDMAAYMKEDKMDWPALDYSKKASTPELTKYGGPGIPSWSSWTLREGDPNSYEGSNYVGPRKVLADIDKTLKAEPASAAGADAGAATGTKKVGSSSFTTSSRRSRREVAGTGARDERRDSLRAKAARPALDTLSFDPRRPLLLLLRAAVNQSKLGAACWGLRS